MKKRTLLLCAILMVAAFAGDPATHLSALFAGRPSWQLEEYAPAVTSERSTAFNISPERCGDYIMCKESPESGRMIKTVLTIVRE
ncbi:MAG: hypothetical protein MUF22_05020 [Chitinispirillaceae bacterium]|nr:hypothetical protein [Chitinispirillaceae bacterium]